MTQRKKAYLYIKRIARILVVLLFLFALLVLFVRSRWGQELILGEVISYVKEKTGTELTIDKLYLTFSGNLALEGLYLEDLHQDTLLYSKTLEADIGLNKLLFANTFQINTLDWSGVRLNIDRSETGEAFNYDFLLDALGEPESPADDASEETIKIEIGSIKLENVRADFEDAYMGISSANRIGTLQIQVETIDLELFHFYFEEISLKNSELSYRQSKPFSEKEAPSEGQAPKLRCNNLIVDNFNASYQSIPDGLLADAHVTQFRTGIPKMDLDKAHYEISGLRLQDSKVSVEIKEATAVDQDTIAQRQPFAWPDLVIELDDIALVNNRFSFSSKATDTASPKKSFTNMMLSNIDLLVPQFQYSPKKAIWKIHQLSLNEKAGLKVEKFVTEGRATETNLEIKSLEVITSGSALIGNADLHYASVEELINAPEKADFRLDLPSYQIDIGEVLALLPGTQNDSLLQALAQEPIEGKLMVQNTSEAATRLKAEARWGETTELRLNGTVYNSFSTEVSRFELDTITASSGRRDISRMGLLRDTTVYLPKRIAVFGTAIGKLDRFNTDIQLISSLGNASYMGKGGFSKIPFLEGTLRIDSLQVDSILRNPSLGTTSLVTELKVQGNDLEDFTGNFDVDVQEFPLNGYIYRELEANGKFTNGTGTAQLGYHDKNLHFKGSTRISLGNSNYRFSSDIDLIGANLGGLNLTRNDIKIAAQMHVEFDGDSKNFALDSKISEVISVLNNEQYQTADILLSARITPDRTEAHVESGFLNGHLDANADPNAIFEAMLQQWNRYFIDSTVTNENRDTLLVAFKAKLTPEPILTEVFLIGTQRFDTIAMSATFDTSSQKLKAELHAPFVNYNGTIVDSLHLTIDGDADNLDFSSGLANLQYDPIQIKKTFFKGTLQNKELSLDFLAYDDTAKLAHIASEMRWKDKTLFLHINPDALLLNGDSWSVPAENEMTIAQDKATFEQMIFSKGEQQITLSNDVSENDKEHLGVLFDNFRLQTVLSLLNPDDTLVSGRVDGKVVLENPFGKMGLLADMGISDLGFMGNRLGDLSMKASSQSLADYDIGMKIDDGGLELDLNGTYSAVTEMTELDLDLSVKKLETKIISGFFSEELQSPEGFVSGTFDVKGTTINPVYSGTLTFNGTSVDIVPLNTTFSITDETIAIDEASVAFDDFIIADAKGSSFAIDGTIGTVEFTNPSFDLHLNAEEFRLLDATKEVNDLYYGIASVDADIDITGDVSLPKVDGKIRVRKVTELTYIIPEEQLDIEERDGVVIFVNRENPNAILTQQANESTPDLFLGYDVDLIIELAEDAIFTMVLDEKTGDVLEVAGDATLNLSLNPNGAIGLTGRYTLKNGFYRTSLYNLVSRKFNLQPGGTINWQGDPMDAKLDVTAIYQLETSAAPLMASVTSGVEATLASKYQQVMPFLVYLNIDGEITAPQLSFDLGIPENARGDLGGAVYGKVQQLNEQETELNKQVFSLLALNRFFPNTTSDGSSGGATGLARNNVNKVLSGELNAFSEKVFGNSGFDVDFDLDSFTDYSGENAQDRTQLNINAQKKLFNDRLIVTAGSAIDVEGSAQAGQEETPIIGNVSLEYLLTKNGRYRLKGFRKNQYVNVIDGQLILTGLALIFNRDFNEFSELFNPIRSNEEDGIQNKRSKPEDPVRKKENEK